MIELWGVYAGERKTEDKTGIFLDPASLLEQLKPDVSKLKEGDEVWVRCKNIRIGKGIFGEMGDKDDNDIVFWKKDIIAHFPAPKPAEMELPEQLNLDETFDEEEVKNTINQLIRTVKIIQKNVENLLNKGSVIEK